MKFDRSDKFDFCYYGQVNSLRLKSTAASKWAIVNTFQGNIYFAGDVHAMTHKYMASDIMHLVFMIYICI